MLLIARVAAAVAGLIFCVPFHYLWKLFGLRPIWPQLFLYYVGRCAGLRVTVTGRPLAGHVLFAANHVSWLDILALGGTSRAQFVSRDDVAGWPLVGWLAGLNRTLYVARHARRDVHGQADQIRQALGQGRAVALFPEGGTNLALGPFRPSLFASLFPPMPGVKVQPVAIDYGPLTEAIAWVGDEGAGTNALRVLALRGGIPVEVHFLEPIDPAAVGDRKALAALAQAEIAAVLGASGGGADPLYGRR